MAKGGSAIKRYCCLGNGLKRTFALKRFGRAVNQLSDRSDPQGLPVAVGRPRITMRLAGRWSISRQAKEALLSGSLLCNLTLNSSRERNTLSDEGSSRRCSFDAALATPTLSELHQ
jgi:hypothetical protein